MVTSVTSSSQAYSAFAAQRQALFQKADTDSSGGLNIDEFKSLGGTKDGKQTDGAPSIEDIFSQVDVDGNGELTTSELDAFAEANFKNRLAQGGPLSGDNLLQLASDDRTQAFVDAADEDGDGVLNLEEFSAAKPKDAPEGRPSSEEIFAQLDTDGDGSLTTAELSAGQPQGGLGGAGGPPPAGGAHGAHGGGGAPKSDDDEDETSSTTFDPLDTNQDGTVSAAERMAGLLGDSKKDINTLVSQTLSTLLGEQEKLAA